MIVARDNEIEHFVPKPYWTLTTKYRDTVFTNSSFQTQQAAEEALALARRSPLIIKDVLEKRSSELPLQLYDLTSLQVDCNRKFGFSADTTLKNLQSLYEKKLTSYPRVDTRFLTDDIYPKCPGIIANLTDVCAGARPLVGHQLPKSKRVFDNSKVTDHHAIIPTGDTRNLGTLNDFEHKVYDLVVRRFCVAFYPACEYANTTVLANAGSLTFKVTGRTILSEGWRAVYGKELIDDDSQSNEKVTLPSFRVGESGQHTPFIEKKMTTAPKHYTEASLLQAMETAGKFIDDETLKEAMKENGIGRPSSRASIIETLVKRGYVRRDHRNLISNPAGRNLIAQIHSTLLKSPELTGQWEHKLRQIERGSYSLQDFMQELEHQLVTMIKEVQST
jgi:DNA topoisomerase-3